MELLSGGYHPCAADTQYKPVAWDLKVSKQKICKLTLGLVLGMAWSLGKMAESFKVTF